MKIAHFIPAYRSALHIESAYTLVRDAMWCEWHEHELLPFYRATSSIDVARNYALRTAIEHGCDLLVMMDADVFVPGPSSAIEPLIAAWEATGAAVVGAPVVTRRNDGAVNVTPEGDVGTGLMLVDVAQLARVPAPWFRTTLDERGELRCGEDIGFCQLVRQHGLRVHVATEIATGHADERVLAYAPDQFSQPGAVTSVAAPAATVEAIASALSACVGCDDAHGDDARSVEE